MKQYNRIYRALVAYGHSGIKALEVIVDARRGDRHARLWIGHIIAQRRG